MFAPSSSLDSTPLPSMVLPFPSVVGLRAMYVIDDLRVVRVIDGLRARFWMCGPSCPKCQLFY
jgi:hypothetical protein